MRYNKRVNKQLLHARRFFKTFHVSRFTFYPSLRSFHAPRSTLHDKKGFTLIELLVFSGIFVFIMVAFITIFITITRVGTRQSAAAEVNQQSNFLIRQVQYYIEQSSLIELDQDQATSTLKLRMAASSTDPTYIYLSASTTYLRQTDGGTAFPLTSNKVNVTGLAFTKRSNSPSRDVVDVQFTVTNNTQNIQQQFSQSINTSIARLNAAVFDSNLLPSSTATYHLGVATHTWNSVNEKLYLAGLNVGIGTPYPTQALEIDGGLRLSTSSATSTCTASLRGTLWVTQGAVGAGNGYSYYRTITIDEAVVSSTLTNFPVLVSSTITGLKHTANGGSVTDVDGDDIIFTSDAAGGTLLDFERERYVSSTGAIYYWVQVPSLSDSASTTIYMFYGNSSVSSYQSSATSTWDSNYEGVFHLKDGVTLDLTDSTNNGFNGANGGATATSGKLDGAAQFVGASSQWVDLGSSRAWLKNTSATTLSAWVKTTISAAEKKVFQFTAPTAAPRANMGVDFGGTTADFGCKATAGDAETPQANDTTVADVPNNTWQYLVCTIDYANDVIRLFQDGQEQAAQTNESFTATVTSNTNITNSALGADSDPTPNDFHDGQIDEARISRIARSTGWILTEYNNQSAPSTFYAVGSEAAGGGAGVKDAVVVCAKDASNAYDWRTIY